MKRIIVLTLAILCMACQKEEAFTVEVNDLVDTYWREVACYLYEKEDGVYQKEVNIVNWTGYSPTSLLIEQAQITTYRDMIYLPGIAGMSGPKRCKDRGSYQYDQIGRAHV